MDHVPGGFVLLSRGLAESEVWRWDSHHLRFWVYLLMSVNARKDRPVKLGAVTVGYGQVLKSFRKIREENECVENREIKQWSQSRVGRMLARFEDAGMIVTLGTGLGTLITVQNFALFQDFGAYSAELGTEPGTQWGQCGDNNKALKALSTSSNGAGKKQDRPPPSADVTEPTTDAGRAVVEFVTRVGATWSLKQSPDKWAAKLELPHIDIIAELDEACEWFEEALASGKRKGCTGPSRFLRNWLKRAEADAAKLNGSTRRTGASLTPERLRAMFPEGKAP